MHTNSKEWSPKIAILVLNWNRPHDTLECLRSLERIQYPHFETILIDNGSKDDSVSLIKSAYPSLQILQNGENLGFAEGYNCGIRLAMDQGFDALLLLNNDTVVHPKILDAFVDAARNHPKAAVFGAKIYFYDEPTYIWYAGGDVHVKKGRCFHIGCGECDLEKKRETIEKTGYACGCALFVKTEAIFNVGLLSPEFFLLWEEIDWCWRFKNKGYECLFVPQAKVWHKISTSFEEGNRGPTWQYYYFRNRLLFLKRHVSFKKRLSFYLHTFPKELIDLFKTSYSSQTDLSTKKQYKAALKGTLDYFFRRLGSKT